MQPAVQLWWHGGLRSQDLNYLCGAGESPGCPGVGPAPAARPSHAAMGLVDPRALLGFMDVWHHWQPIRKCFRAEFRSYFIMYLYSVQIFLGFSSIHFVTESVCQYDLGGKKGMKIACLPLFFCNSAGWWNAIESIAGTLQNSYYGNDFLPPAAVMLRADLGRLLCAPC